MAKLRSKGQRLLNYTTTIDAAKTASEIVARLVANGARKIGLEYDERRRPSWISFRAETPFGEQSYRLPVNLAAVETTLGRLAHAGKIPARYATRDQAERTGWRIVKDWIEVQMAIVAVGMASLDEVMLPYMLQGDTTFYRFTVDRMLALPKPR
jgi:hypothetical protein